MMTTTSTPYRSAQKPGRDGFRQLLRAEWTKLRTVRGWVIALLAVTALTAAVPIWLASTATSNSVESCVSAQQCQAEGQSIATGPAGTAVIDNFYFLHQPIASSGTITVRVSSLHGSGAIPHVPSGFAPAPTTEPWAKAGIMIKGSTKPGSAYASVLVTGSHGVRMQYDYTHDVAGSSVSAATPQWLRLTRSGDLITGYESANGRQWTAIGSASLARLPSTAQAGLFVASPTFNEAVGSGDSTTGGPTQATGAFDHLSLHGGSAGQVWTGTEIGSQSRQGPPPGVHVHCTGPGCSAPPSPSHGFTARAGALTVTGSGDIAPFEPIVDPLHVVFLSTVFGLIVAIALGILFMTVEYRRDLIRITATASPRRGRILVAKAMVIGSVTFVAALIGSAIAFPIAESKIYANGWRPPVWPQLSVFSSTGLQVVLGTAALAAGAAILGLAAGTIFRRSAAAVMAVIGVLVIPVILALVLPLTPANWLLRITPAAAFSLQQTTPKYSQVANVCAPYHSCFPLSAWQGFAVLCAWVAVALASAIYLLRKRDL